MESVATASAALSAYHRVDLVLLELDLPDVDGLEVCRKIRTDDVTPIITVTARRAELDRVLGLQAGCDDYVVKPYSFRELMARIDAVMRRCVPRRDRPRARILRGPLRIDPAVREVRIHDRPVNLTRKEFDFLYILAVNSEKVVSREQILTAVWEYDTSVSSRTIDTHACSLRGKLGAPGWLVTVRGVGFRLGRG